LKEKLLKYFNELKSGQKRIFVLLGVGAAVTLIGVFGYINSSRKQVLVKETQSANTKSSPVNMDNGLMAKSELLDAKKDALVAIEKAEALKKQQEEAEKAKASGLMPPEGTMQKGSATGAPAEKAVKKALPPVPSRKNRMPELPPPPNLSQSSLPPGMPPAANPNAAMNDEREIGGISRVKGEVSADSKEDKKKDKKKSVYLPISYMRATLLSGLNAPTNMAGSGSTMGGGGGHPVPVLIRVKTPAVLPNEVKANLRGCFVIADGKGNLATERAELVLVSLSCIDRKGQSVIDQKLTGIVVDADGKAGLKGRVVTKMGAMIARSMIAGMMGGFGDALKTTSTTTSLSALGGVETIDPKKIGMAGLGSGLSSAFKDTQRFYLNLARQTFPVIEIGAARPVTILITRGVNLDIKKISKEGN